MRLIAHLGLPARPGARAAFGVTVAAGVLAALIALAGAGTFSRAGR